MKKFFANDKRLHIVEKGLSDNEGFVYFKPASSGGTIVEDDDKDDEGIIRIPVISIDSVELCRNATFIKMDIEGSEMKALEGAKQTILCNKPKLTICIYHSDEDMVRIAEYIHSLVPEYKLYIRHHTSEKNETVLYAVIEKD